MNYIVTKLARVDCLLVARIAHTLQGFISFLG